MWRVDDRCRLGPQRRDGRPLPDHPESTCRAVSLRGNHEVCGTHSFFTQVDGVSIPSGALGFKRSTTGAQKGSRPAVTVRAHNGRTRRRNRLPRVSRSRPAPVRPSLPARGARPTGRRRPALAGLSAGPARPGRPVPSTGPVSSNRSRRPRTTSRRTRSGRPRRTSDRPRRSGRRDGRPRRPRGGGHRSRSRRTTCCPRPSRPPPTSWCRRPPRPPNACAPGHGRASCRPPSRWPGRRAPPIRRTPPRSRLPSPTVLP